MPPVEGPERVLVVAVDDVTVAVLEQRGGPVFAPGSIGAPLLVHASLCGRFAAMHRASEVLAALGATAAIDDVLARLRAAGFEVRQTPRSAVRRLLDG